MKKQYIIRKYIMAENGLQALKIEKKYKAHECWIDAEWQKENLVIAKNIDGFIKNKK